MTSEVIDTMTGRADAGRGRWRRICLLVDTADTAHGAAHIVRGDVPRRSATALTAASGSYAALGLAGLLFESRRPQPGREARSGLIQ